MIRTIDSSETIDVEVWYIVKGTLNAKEQRPYFVEDIVVPITAQPSFEDFIEFDWHRGGKEGEFWYECKHLIKVSLPVNLETLDLVSTINEIWRDVLEPAFFDVRVSDYLEKPLDRRQERL